MQMAVGDKASCPKGGRAQYRSKPWYKTVGGRLQGEFMSKKTEKEYGHGAFAGEPCRFVTIEQKISAIAKFYDEVRAAATGVVIMKRGGTGRESTRRECGAARRRVCRTAVAGSQRHKPAKPGAQRTSAEVAQDAGEDDGPRASALAEAAEELVRLLGAVAGARQVRVVSARHRDEESE